MTPFYGEQTFSAGLFEGKQAPKWGAWSFREARRKSYSKYKGEKSMLGMFPASILLCVDFQWCAWNWSRYVLSLTCHCLFACLPSKVQCLHLQGVKWSHRFMCHVVSSEPCLFSHLHTGSLQQMELKESRQQTFGWPLVGHMEACTRTVEAKRKKIKCINVKKGIFYTPRVMASII